MSNKFWTCLWYDNNALDAANFYATVFKNSKIGQITHSTPEGAKVSGQPVGSILTVDFRLEDHNFQAVNGGPIFKPTPAFSYLVTCETEAEIQEKWKQLSQDGNVRMGLDKYPWAERYGWATDRFGVDWQLMLSPGRKPKIAPTLLFVDQLFGKAEEAMKFYVSIFDDSQVGEISRDDKGTLLHADFRLGDQAFSVMNGPGKHGFEFSTANSIVAICEDQSQVDRYWSKLLQGGGQEQPCGWLADRYGVAWQVVPRVMLEMMNDKDPARADRVFREMVKMKKLDIAALEKAARG